MIPQSFTYFSTYFENIPCKEKKKKKKTNLKILKLILTSHKIEIYRTIVSNCNYEMRVGLDVIYLS